METISIRPVSASADAASIAEIYNHYIRETVITFEEQELRKEQVMERIKSVISASMPWLVAEIDGEIIGYCYAGKFHTRSAYRFTVEATVYLDQNAGGKGVGTKLYQALINQLKQQKYHSVIGIIALPNEASIKLHEKFGFKKIGHFAEVGFKFNRWHDVGYWQVILKA